MVRFHHQYGPRPSTFGDVDQPAVGFSCIFEFPGRRRAGIDYRDDLFRHYSIAEAYV